jgi:hypothetical protein
MHGFTVNKLGLHLGAEGLLLLRRLGLHAAAGLADALVGGGKENRRAAHGSKTI